MDWESNGVESKLKLNSTAKNQMNNLKAQNRFKIQPILPQKNINLDKHSLQKPPQKSNPQIDTEKPYLVI